MARRYLFTSESVTEGHPDKICDQISDTILDALLTQDPKSRVAAEVVVNTGLLLLTGEITTKAQVNYIEVARKKIAEIEAAGKANAMKIEADAIKMANDTNNKTLTAPILKLRQIEAFKSLSNSSNSKLIITDGKTPFLSLPDKL